MIRKTTERIPTVMGGLFSRRKFWSRKEPDNQSAFNLDAITEAREFLFVYFHIHCAITFFQSFVLISFYVRIKIRIFSVCAPPA